MNRKTTIALSLLALILIAAVPAGAAPLYSAALRDLVAAPCTAGQGYNPACDADHDGDVDVLDIQLTAGRWGSSGTFVADGWSLTGNAGIVPGTNFLGTTDNQALEIRVNNQPALRIEPATIPNLIGGSVSNTVTPGVYGATVAGGGFVNVQFNSVTDHFGTVSGGRANRAGDNAGTAGDREHATVGGGYNNHASGQSSTVGGGSGNTSSGLGSFVGGGESNSTQANWATIGGGYDNIVTAPMGTIGGGSNNQAYGTNATVAGGWVNRASGASAAVGGGTNNWAAGDHATVPGGEENLAAGSYSFAAGRRAKAGNPGAFVLADSNDFDFAPGVNNAFTARFTGGARFILGINASGQSTWTCAVYNGGSWGCSSDRTLKENFQPVDGKEILKKLAALPITTWNAIGTDPNVKRMGPMAQDFYAAFGLGDDDNVITTGDLDGVALASIQGLYLILQELQADNQALRADNAALHAQMAEIDARLAALDAVK